MKKGSIKSEITSVAMHGVAGTGKSSSMNLILGNPPEEDRKSTPLVARPATVHEVDPSLNWTKHDSKMKSLILARAIRSARDGIESDSDEDTSNFDEVEEGSQVPTISVGTGDTEHMSSTHDTPPQLHPSMASPSGVQMSESESGTPLHSISTHDNLTQMMDDVNEAPLPVMRKVKFIDCGGQPEFYEILPRFMRPMNLYICVLKLSEELSAKPLVEYFNQEGKCVGTPYLSSRSNQHLMRYLIRSLRSLKSSTRNESWRSRIMVIGTHRDKEEECTGETREMKNKKLAEILLPEFKDEVVYFDLLKHEFIFPVNAKYPVVADKNVANQIQELILSKCRPKPIPVPFQYYGLEILLEEVSQSQNRGIFSKLECLEAARDLHFDQHTLDGALQFLHNISEVFYFPEILPNLVFTNPQVIVDKLTEFVEAIYSVRETGGVSTGEWQKFKDYGRFSLEFLLQNEFQMHYKPGVFTPVELVKLFKELLIIADFDDGEYFMPALLMVLEDDILSDYRVPPDSPAAPLTLDFPLGGPPLGMYCSLNCFLISDENLNPKPWKIELTPHSYSPTCLYRNCVRFSVPGFPGSVTLIDTFSHFEIHVSTVSPKLPLVSKLATYVHRAIVAGVKKANLTLGYNSFTPSPSLLCPCGVGDLHVSTFGEGVWICSKDNKICGDLTERDKIWQIKSEDTSHQGIYYYNYKTL